MSETYKPPRDILGDAIGVEVKRCTLVPKCGPAVFVTFGPGNGDDSLMLLDADTAQYVGEVLIRAAEKVRQSVKAGRIVKLVKP